MSDIELDDECTWHVLTPVKIVCFVSAYDENVLLVDDSDLAFRNAFLVYFELRPAHFVEVIVGMLVEFGEVEDLVKCGRVLQLLRHAQQPTVLLLHSRQLVRQVRHTLVRTVHMTHKGTFRTVIYHSRTGLLMCEQFLVWHDLVATAITVTAMEVYLLQ